MDIADILVNEHMAPLGMSVRDLSELSGVPIGKLAKVCNGEEPVCDEVAFALESIFGKPSSYWLGM